MPRHAITRRDAGHMSSQHPAQTLQRTPTADGKMRMQPVYRVNGGKSLRWEVLKGLWPDEIGLDEGFLQRKHRLTSLDNLGLGYSKYSKCLLRLRILPKIYFFFRKFQVMDFYYSCMIILISR